MEERFLQEQHTYWHNPEFLMNMTVNDTGTIDHTLWDSIPEDHNDAKVGAVTVDDKNGEVTLVDVIQFKGVARKLEPSIKPFNQVQT